MLQTVCYVFLLTTYTALYLLLVASNFIYWFQNLKIWLGEEIHTWRKSVISCCTLQYSNLKNFLRESFLERFYSALSLKTRILNKQYMYAINDPLGQTHRPANSDHYSHLIFVLREFEKWRRTDGRTTCLKIVTVSRPRGSISAAQELNQASSAHQLMLQSRYVIQTKHALNKEFPLPTDHCYVFLHDMIRQEFRRWREKDIHKHRLR